MQGNETAQLRTRDGEALALEGVRVEGRMRGACFEASVIQRFRNPRERPVELVYTFPLPAAAVLLGVEVQLGACALSGAVIPKAQAERDYEEAFADGNTAIRVEQNPDGSFTVSLGNLGPQETGTIRLRYAQVLAFEQRGLRLVIPTVIAPRYGDPLSDAGLRPHQRVEHDLLAEYPFDVQVRIEGPLARAQIGSPSHPLAMRLEGEGATTAMRVSLTRTGALDRDFVLVLDGIAQDSLAVCAADTVSPGAVGVLASFSPRVPAATHPLAVKILVDCSGSMQGDSIAAARRALQAILRGLSPGERFSLSRFGSTVEHRSRALWRTTAATRLAGQRWTAALQADLGGTEMEAALRSTLSLAGDERAVAPVDLLLITDGEIHAIERTVGEARASGHRVFVVGIGSAPAERLLRRLAQETGGACDFVAPGEAVEPAVLRMFARLRSQRMAGLALQWPAGVAPMWVSTLPKSVFDGDAVTVWARFPRAPEGVLRLMGPVGEAGAPPCLGEVDLGAVRDDETFMRMAAAAQVHALMQDDGRHDAEALALAVDYQLVGPLTHFLLVDARAAADRPADLPELLKVKSMLPAGWSGMGSVVCTDVTDHVPMMADNVLHCDVPAVIRSGNRRPAAASGIDGYDIPAFLRKGAGRAPTNTSRDDARDWRADPHYTGLTPLGLTRWLQTHAPSSWPRCYADLRKIGLGQAVVDWLEFVLAEGEPEARVVAAFLQAMAQREMRDALQASTGAIGRLKALAQRLGKGATRGEGPDGIGTPAIASRLRALLSTLQADAWPDGMLDLQDVDLSPA